MLWLYFAESTASLPQWLSSLTVAGYWVATPEVARYHPISHQIPTHSDYFSLLLLWSPVPYATLLEAAAVGSASSETLAIAETACTGRVAFSTLETVENLAD